MDKGYLIVYTGSGKGKTTAALGLALRAAGHGLNVCIVQFIKGSWHCGEMESIRRFEGLIDLYTLGKGFTWNSKNIEDDKKAARYAYIFATDAALSGKYSMVIMDEFTYAMNYKMIEEKEAISFFTNRPKDVHIVVTGRGASNALISMADIVTEMKEIKHPFSSGYSARKGIEF